MPTTGDRGNHRSWRLIAFTAIAGGLTALALGTGGQSQALSPPPADKAEIIYSNGGRIIQINADGSDRKVLTRKGKVRTPGIAGQHGDRFPAVSPDGTRVLFSRHTSQLDPDNEFFYSGSSRNMLLNLTTGRTREVLPGTRNVHYGNLAWLPGTERVLASKSVYGKVSKRFVVSVRLDGSGERRIVRFRDYRRGFPSDNHNFEAARLDASPDGNRFLMTRMDIWSEYGYALELVDVATGKRKLISKEAHSGTWSPGGEQIAFVRDHKKELVCDWSFACTPSGDIVLADGNGSNLRPLTRTSRDEASPTFSPDGSHIAFSGTIVHPDDRDTSEIFSIGTDGKCLVGLTNGSPASIDPDFVPGSGDLQAPGYCGLKSRPVLAEGHLNPRMNGGLGRRLWAGPQSSQGLLSFDGDIAFLSFAVYRDCGSYQSRECPKGAAISTFPVCGGSTDWADFVAALARFEGPKKRGVIVANTGKGKRAQTLVFSGSQITQIGTGENAGSGTMKPLSKQERLALVKELRPVGGKLQPKLPRFLLPAIDFRIAARMTRLVKRSSVAKAAELYRMDREEVINWLNFRKNVKRIDAGRTTCPRSIKTGLEGF